MTNLKSFYKAFVNFLNSRRLIFELARNDIQSRYLGSYLGVFWAFIQPLITILIFWFVFQVGFKSMPINNVPFILWLVPGILPWFFFNDGLLSATNAIIENTYLVKKVIFNVSILPIVKIMSSLFIHLFFVVFIFILYGMYGYFPSIYNVQVVYYLIATLCFLFGLSLITSSLVVFLKDIGQIIGMILQFGFWITPIFWSFKILPERYRYFFKLNPMYYIVEGYRDSFINHVWFWQHYQLTAFFWIITFCFIIIGGTLFKKLRPHFADVI